MPASWAALPAPAGPADHRWTSAGAPRSGVRCFSNTFLERAASRIRARVKPGRVAFRESVTLTWLFVREPGPHEPRPFEGGKRMTGLAKKPSAEPPSGRAFLKRRVFREINHAPPARPAHALDPVLVPPRPRLENKWGPPPAGVKTCFFPGWLHVPVLSHEPPSPEANRYQLLSNSPPAPMLPAMLRNLRRARHPHYPDLAWAPPPATVPLSQRLPRRGHRHPP